MNEPTCACGRPCRDGTFCVSCAYRLDEYIAQVGAYHGLAWDLQVGVSRQDRITRPLGRPDVTDRDDVRQWPGTLRPTAIPYADVPSAAAGALHTVLKRWADRVAAETGLQSWTSSGHLGPTCARCHHFTCQLIRPPVLPPTGPGQLAELARWLRPRVGWLRHHPRGQDAYDEIITAVCDARRAVDRPVNRTYVGPCDTCGADMYVRQGASAVVCGECSEAYDVETRRRWLLAAAEDVLGTTTEIARALTSLAAPVTEEMIRGYAHRGRLLARGHRTAGHRSVPIYRLGDVANIIAGIDRQIGPTCRRRCEHSSCSAITQHRQLRAAAARAATA